MTRPVLCGMLASVHQLLFPESRGNLGRLSKKWPREANNITSKMSSWEKHSLSAFTGVEPIHPTWKAELVGA